MKLMAALCLIALVNAKPQRFRQPQQFALPQQLTLPQPQLLPQSPQRSASREADAQTVRYYNDFGRGTYRWVFVTSNDIFHAQQSEVRNQGTDNEFLAVKGTYGHIGPNNIRYITKYTADENGYQANTEEGPGGAPLPPDTVATLLDG